MNPQRSAGVVPFSRTFHTDRTFLIPPELRALPQWVVWRAEQRGDAFTKVPVNPHTGALASVSNPKTWGRFDLAVERYADDSTLAGIGFVLTESAGIVGGDLDHCLAGDQALKPWAAPILEQLDTYTEISPSGTGLRVIGRGRLPQAGRRKTIEDGGVELYRDHRFLTITGRIYSTDRGELRDVQTAGNALWRALFGEPEQPQGDEHESGAGEPWRSVEVTLRADAEPPASKLLAALDADRQFRNTWERSRPDLTDKSPSGYCLSLASVAVATGWSDQETVDLLILWRRKHGEDLKLDRLDWYQRTIWRAHATREANQNRQQYQEALSRLATAQEEQVAGDELKEMIRRLLGVPLARFVQVGTEDAHYYLQLDNGDAIPLGGYQAVVDQESWRKLLFERGFEPFSKLKGAQWERVIRALTKLRVLKEERQTGKTTRLTRYIAEYMERAAEDGQDDRYQAGILAGKPFLREGILHLHVPSFAAHIRGLYRDAQMTQDTIIALLKGMGWVRRTQGARTGRGTTTRSYYQRPLVEFENDTTKID